MGITADFSFKAFKELMNAIPDIFAGEIVRAFSYLGEQCVRPVRDRAGDESWFDQTGNLRSSIGYAVYEEGKILIESAFNQVKKGAQGANEGRKLIEELASKYAQTYALVVVAGMEYSEYVEAMKGKDVLASTELWAKGKMNECLEKAKERALGKILQLQQQLGL
ncbi:MAG: hypothetical protein K2H76_06160 [Muribaculaceae bacterium]|nr:hypothetical protein [Muribaculaceae bacterium]